MANQRPIRKRRRRFYGLKKRPTRWIAEGGQVSDEPVGGQGFVASTLANEALLINQGVPPYATIVQGEFDVEPWSDDEEVTIDRIVGDLSWVGNVQYSGVAPKLVIRAGIIVAEDVSDDPGAPDPTRSLFDFSDLQEAEWLWLHQFTPDADGRLESSGTQPDVDWLVSHNVHVDIRCRRKLGQKDILYLYTSYVPENNHPSFTQSIKCVPLLRTICMGR